MFEVITEWSTAGSPGGLSVMYFDELATISTIRTNLGTLWGSIDNQLTTSTTWTVRTSGRVLNPANGQLTGDWSDATVYTGSGGLGGSGVANATQILLRWRTSTIANGRRILGRTFVPGMGAGLLANGEIAETSRAAMAAAADAFQTGMTSFVIWSRPQTGRAGQTATVTGADCWGELATQRRRRD